VIARSLPRPVVLGLAALALVWARSLRAETVPAPDEVDRRIEAVVAGELAAMHATTAADLVQGAPARPLVAADSFSPDHGDGRGRIVVVGLAPGEPGNLPIATELEYLRFTVRLDDGGTTVVGERPSRDDLVTAVRSVLADEGRAIEAAAAALTARKAALPAGRDSWRAALRGATYDARLPRERFYGEPGWQFVFDPWDESRGGYHGVLLDAKLNVTSVDGRSP
jgi:hypothetical protein